MSIFFYKFITPLGPAGDKLTTNDLIQKGYFHSAFGFSATNVIKARVWESSGNPWEFYHNIGNNFCKWIKKFCRLSKVQSIVSINCRNLNIWSKIKCKCAKIPVQLNHRQSDEFGPAIWQEETDADSWLWPASVMDNR